MPSKIVSVRFPDAELAELRAHAEKAGLGVSEYVRRAAVGDLDATASPAAVQPSPPAPDAPAPAQPNEAKVEARAKLIYGRDGIPMARARAQARRELAAPVAP